ncbi:hypothetical protein GCM10025859_35290 [Alicyclobacillus fastidiosus]|nr:hypothetical protein GCM10025859_35290 [Alicyclobacillus fastidiosus]
MLKISSDAVDVEGGSSVFEALWVTTFKSCGDFAHPLKVTIANKDNGTIVNLGSEN